MWLTRFTQFIAKACERKSITWNSFCNHPLVLFWKLTYFTKTLTYSFRISQEHLSQFKYHRLQSQGICFLFHFWTSNTWLLLHIWISVPLHEHWNTQSFWKWHRHIIGTEDKQQKYQENSRKNKHQPRSSTELRYMTNCAIREAL